MREHLLPYVYPGFDLGVSCFPVAREVWASNGLAFAQYHSRRGVMRQSKSLIEPEMGWAQLTEVASCSLTNPLHDTSIWFHSRRSIVLIYNGYPLNLLLGYVLLIIHYLQLMRSQKAEICNCWHFIVFSFFLLLV